MATDLERERLEALYRLELLDTESEPEFDALTELAVALTGARMSAISLVDADRQWFKSNINVPADETPRDVAFCAHTIANDEVFYIPNAEADDRFRDNPLVTGDPHIRGYAGVPIKSPDGYRVGTLCAIDDKPFDLSTETLGQLEALGRLLEDRISDRQRTHRELRDNRMIAAIARIQTEFIAETSDIHQAYEHLLDVMIEFTDSEDGFIGEILEDDEGTYLDVHAIQIKDTSPEATAQRDQHLEDGLKFRNTNSLLGRVIETQSVVISNDVASDPRASGRPKGHFELKTYLGIPLFDGDKMIAMVGVANRKNGYDEHLVQICQPLVVTISSLIRAQRLRDQNDEIQSEIAQEKGRYDLAIAGASVGVWELDFRNDTMFASQRLIDIIGREDDGGDLSVNLRSAGLSAWIERVHPDERDEVRERLEHHLATREPYEIEYRFRHADGHYVEIFVRGQAEWDADGVPIRMAGSAVDISASAELERERERVADRLAAVSELGGIGAWEVDMQTGHPEWDAVTRAIHEVPDDYEPTMESAINFYAPEARDSITEAVEAGIASGEGWDAELPLITAKGNRIWVRAVGRAIKEGGEVRKLLGSFQDITERKLREAELKSLSDRLTLAMDTSGIGAWEMDLEQGTHWWDDGSKRMFGLALDEDAPLLEVWRSFIHPDDLEWLIKAVDNAIEQRGPYDVNYRIIRSDGELRYIRSRGVFRTGVDGTTIFSGVNIDVTDDVEIQAELDRRRRSAEEANAAKSQFLANMSHEIRTPLNGVLGMAQLLKMTELTARQTEYVDTLKTSGRALLELIEDILDISKIEAGMVEVSTGEIVIDELVQGVVDVTRGTAAGKDLELSFEIDSKVPPTVLGDEKHTRQVLINILGNAVKFTDAGSISVAVTATAAHTLRFTITDTGPGIPEDMRDNIFDRFAQVDMSSTRKHGGTGLGLAICRDLVSIMGGQIGVKSKLGEGASFWFELPMPSTGLSEQRVMPLHTEENLAVNKVLRVLVVDDVKTNQLVASALLQEAGHSVDLAANGQEALEALETSEYDVVFMDIQMPVMPGDEAIRRIRRAGKPYSDVPIFAVTADATKGASERYCAAGADGYLAKPLELDAIQHALGLSVRKVA